jgi:hypothetical protein
MLNRLFDYLIREVLDPVGRWLDDHADQLIAVLFHRITRSVAAWLLALLIAYLNLDLAWHCYDNVCSVKFRSAYEEDWHFHSTYRSPSRAQEVGGSLERQKYVTKVDSAEDGQRIDENYGHTTIDFGGQWMMGAMLVRGHGRQLYNRNVQRQVLILGYPRDQEDPRATGSDADKLMTSFMGSDNDSRRAAQVIGSFTLPLADSDPWSVLVLTTTGADGWHAESLDEVTKPRRGGPLYPPINAFVYAPLGMLPPQVAYRCNQILNLFWALVAAWGVRYLTRGRIWMSMAVTLILLYPGFKGSIHLGQNAALTLAILVWGWALIARDRLIAGGLVWGLLAFKPVWAAAFFLVPFLTFRWRTCIAMLAMGLGLALVTMLFVGWRPWWDWLIVGHEAAELYKTDPNWVFLSRDILGIPRRWLIDFKLLKAERDPPLANLLGWAMFAFCLFSTVILALSRPKEARAVTGTAAGFLLLGAWLSCFHFMYYDMLLTVLPVFVLLAEPRQFCEPILYAVVPLNREAKDGELANYYGPWPANYWPPLLPLLQPVFRNVWTLNRMVPNVVLLLLMIEHLLPHLGIGATVTSFWWQGSRKLTTALYDGGQPWDTYLIIALWLWYGFRWIRTPRPGSSKPPPTVSTYPDAEKVLEAKAEHVV